MVRSLFLGAALILATMLVPGPASEGTAQAAPPDRCTAEAQRFCMRTWQAAGYTSASSCFADLYARFCASPPASPSDYVCFTNPDGSMACWRPSDL